MLGAMLLLLAEAPASAEPPDPPPAATAGPETADGCDEAERGSGDTRTITVCAERPEGYRLDPDVMAAKKAKRRHGRGAAPKSPENFKRDECATVGPMGCREGPVLDYVSAALVAAQMAARAAKGENVGKMFVTDPQPSEYELYQEAKRAREAKEAEEAAAAKAKAETAKAAQPK
jgi:hypothetical protein